MENQDRDVALNYYEKQGGDVTFDNLPTKIATASRDVNMVRMDVADLKHSMTNELKILRSEVQAVAPLGSLYKDILLIIIALMVGSLFTLWIRHLVEKGKAKK